MFFTLYIYVCFSLMLTVFRIVVATLFHESLVLLRLG